MRTWKYLLALSLIFCLCFAGSIQQYQAQIIKMKKAGGGACVTVAQQQLEVDGGDGIVCGASAATTYVASRFDVGGTGYDLCKVGIFIKDLVVDNDPVWAMTLEIRDDNAGEPGTVKGTSSTSIGAGDVGAVFAEVLFAFASPITLIASTSYWITCKFTVIGDGGDFVRWGYDDATWTDNEDSADGTTWVDRANRSAAHVIYK